MSMAAAVRRVVGIFAGMALAVAAVPASAQPDIALDYRIYMGGIAVMSMQTRIALESEVAVSAPYRIDVSARTVGIIDRIKPLSFKARSWGEASPAGLRVERYESVSTKRSKPKRLSIDFVNANAPVAVFDPPPDDPVIQPPASMMNGIIDPPGAFMVVLHAIATNGDCGGTINIYDGKRRYDFVFDEKKADKLEKSDLSIFNGRAVRCHAAVVQRHGFKRKTWSLGGIPTELTVWFAEVLPGTPAVPVRLDTDTGLSGVRIHLTGARLVPVVQESAAGAGSNAHNGAITSSRPSASVPAVP